MITSSFYFYITTIDWLNFWSKQIVELEFCLLGERIHSKSNNNTEI